MPDQPIEPGSITQTSDAQDERISEVSSVSNTINQMQRDVDQRLTEVEQMAGDSEAVGEVQTATVGILHKMQETMGSFAQGINAITIGTATATKDAISQYGKAISEDISYNKQSVVAMALSRSTPIFGYFAAKFMETDVFRKAKEKMAESLKGVFSGVGKTISGFFKGKKEGEDDIPKMQGGGYVKKGGMVEVHAGEIVAPIEKVLSRIDESVSAVQEIGVTFKRAQLHNMANMAGYVKGQEKLEKVGIFKGFLRAMNQVQTQYEEPAQTRMLRALLSIQDSLGATIGTMEQVWTKMLVEHPTFRNIVFSLKSFTSALSFPGKLAYSVFKARGGYKSQLPSAKNPFENISLILGLIYAESMHRLDNIVLNTRHTAWATRDLSTYVTGKTYPPLIGTQKTLWSIMSIARKMLNVSSKWMPAVIAGGIDIMFGGTGKAGWKKGKAIGDWATKERKLWGSTLFNTLMDMTAGRKMEKSLYGELPEGKQIQKELPAPSDDSPIPVRVVDTSDKVKAVEDKKWRDEKKEGADLLSGVNSLYKANVKQHKEDKKEGANLLSGVNSLYAANVKQHKKEFKLQKATAKDLDQMNKRGKFKSFMSMIGGAFSAVKGIIGGLLSTVMDFLGLKKGGLGFLMSAGAFAKFLVPALGVIFAAGLGYAIGSWINKYVGPWLQKKWDEMFAANRKAGAENVAKSWEKSKVARSTGGAEGVKARYQTRLLSTMSSAQANQSVADDPKLEMVKKGQRQFYEKNIGRYLKYPIDSLGPWRKEWINNQSVEGGSGGRGQWFGWGTDPIKFGMKREEKFLNWLDKYKTELTPAQMAEQEQDWTRRVQDSKGTMTKLSEAAKRTIAAAKAKGVQLYDSAGNVIADASAYAKKTGGKFYDKAGNVITDASQLAKDYAKDAKSKGKETIDALGEFADKQLEATKDMTKNFSETVGNQTTSLVNTVSDSSQKMVNQGGKAAGNLYQDLKKTVITGRVDMDTLEMFWD